MKKILFIISIVAGQFTSCTQTNNYDGSFIRFHLYGKGEPVFVLSGGPGNDCHQEEDVAIRIGEKYQAILPEQRGTGLSMPEELSKATINLDAYIRDILFIMDSLKITKAKFYGHSWGAMYASAFAVQYPEKVASLVLTGPGYMKLDKQYQVTIFNNRMAKLSREQRTRFNQLSRKQTDQWTPGEQKEIADLKATFNTYDTTNKAWKFAKIQQGKLNPVTNQLLSEDLERINFSLTEQLKTLNIPVTVITCREDPLAFLTIEFQKFTPRAVVHWLDQCGHFPMYEQPEKFYPLLLDALNR